MLHSVNDLKTMLEDTINNSRLMVHVVKTHEASVTAIYETAQPTKRKRKRPLLADPETEVPEVTALRLKHEAIKLACWPLTIRAASFIRPPRQSDRNTLISIKQLGADPTAEAPARARDVLVFVTVYNRQSWGQKNLSRVSQHVVRASQSIGDFYEAIPCTSNELPEEVRDESGAITGYKARRSDDDMAVEQAGGAVVFIERVLYGDGQSEHDYAEKILQLSQAMPEGQQKAFTKGSSMHDTKFLSLTVRLHEPYWILHAGNCEHFFTITALRLLHPSDPKSGYPLTTQITPPLSDFCRVCSKVPAVYSIIGDVRLGESPFLICAPCWRWMGEPKDDSDVLVVPLPKHELGWTI
ncbi:snRNA-activating protein of 50kDa MW C terminal-domain-containing protein [Fomes fomentarius]|nr:snRNA-activating protein of 50kDa MW C terminal-domain-containing protein [Fomes fomentarius]